LNRFLWRANVLNLHEVLSEILAQIRGVMQCDGVGIGETVNEMKLSVITSLAMTLLNQPTLFEEKLWISLGIGGLIGVAIVIWRAQIKKRKTQNLK
jgi:hypothetical protein